MNTITNATKLSPFAVFRRHSFSLLWIAQCISQLGNGLTSIAAIVLVYQLTGSALSVGLMLIVTALPSLLVGLIAGVAVDRCDRRRMMIAADLARALLVGLIPLLAPFGIAWLYVLVLLASTVAQFFDPAHESVLPAIAPDQELAAANAFMTISYTGAQALGFAAAGLIAARFAIGWAFALDALSFVLSAACIIGVRVPAAAAEPPSAPTNIVHDLRAGLRCVRDTAVLRSLLVLFCLIFFSFGLLNAALLPFTARALHAGAVEYGLIEGIPIFGFVLSSLILAHLADRLHPGQWIAISLLGMGVLQVVIAGLTAVPLAIVVMAGASFMNAPSFIARRLIIQRDTPRELLGRVSSAFFLTRDICFVLGMAAVGMADLLDIRLLYAGAGLVILLAGLLALILPGLRQPAAAWQRLGQAQVAAEEASI